MTAGQVGGSYAAPARHPGHPPATTLAYILLTVGGASLMARRRYPVAVLAVVLRAVRVVAGGNALLSPTVTRRLIAEFASHTRAAHSISGLSSLTARQREVVTSSPRDYPTKRSPARST